MDFKGKRAGRGEVSMDVTPLIDVVFLLLIFFMITTTFANSSGIEVDLPKANSGTNALDAQDIVVAIDNEGRIVYEHKDVSLEELQALLEEIPQDQRNQTVVVQADTITQHGLVVRVMDAIKGAGFSRLAVATQQD